MEKVGQVETGKKVLERLEEEREILWKQGRPNSLLSFDFY